MSPAAFSAEILSAGGGGHAVVVPKEVAAAFATKRPAVLARVDGVEYRSRLAVYGARSYLGLRKDLLRQIGRQAGEVVEIELEEDHADVPAPAEATEPPELLAALAENPAARAAYEALEPSHRREYAKWIGEAKQAETRAERVAKMIGRLGDP
jgi:antitoxin component of MazEF toxin-antitoxin module